MNSLKTQNLLMIIPHFKVFIKDQATLIEQYFKDMVVLMPEPCFSDFAQTLPFAHGEFDFLKLAATSRNDVVHSRRIISPKFLTLPLPVIRKRNCYLAAKTCIKALSKNTPNFDLMHAHFLDNGFIAAKLKRIYNKPFVVTAHGGDVYASPFSSHWHNVFARYVLREADQVITVSQFCSEKLLTLGVSACKLHVIPNGFDEQLFRPMSSQKAREKLGLPLNKKILLSAGNLFDVKGHVYLVEAMQSILKTRNDVILIIIGSGPLKNALEKRAMEKNVHENIFFVGGKSHSEIPIWMNASDIFVLPSLSEGFPTVIPEALACGKPVIGTKVGGVPEVLSNQDVGILVNPRDPVALSNAILVALEKKWQPEVIANYVNRYSWSVLIKQILEVYEAL